MANFDYPTDTAVVDATQKITAPWGLWVNRVHAIVASLQQSGTTADRPNSVLWIGRRYFDTTLTKPVWVKQVKPTVLWCDATGATV